MIGSLLTVLRFTGREERAIKNVQRKGVSLTVRAKRVARQQHYAKTLRAINRKLGQGGVTRERDLAHQRLYLRSCWALLPLWTPYTCPPYSVKCCPPKGMTVTARMPNGSPRNVPLSSSHVLSVKCFRSQLPAHLHKLWGSVRDSLQLPAASGF